MDLLEIMMELNIWCYLIYENVVPFILALAILYDKKICFFHNHANNDETVMMKRTLTFS